MVKLETTTEINLADDVKSDIKDFLINKLTLKISLLNKKGQCEFTGKKAEMKISAEYEYTNGIETVLLSDGYMICDDVKNYISHLIGKTIYIGDKVNIENLI